jgi:hypothetical protein
MRDMARIYLATGYALLKAQGEVEDGMFLQYLDDAGIPKQRAYEAIAAAKLYTRATPEQRKILCDIGKTKATLLAQAEPEVVNALLEDDKLKLDGVSVRQLREYIKTLESDLEDTEKSKEQAARNFQDDIDERNSAISRLQETRYQNPEFTPATNLIRQKARALADHIVAALEQLSKLTAEVIDNNPPEAEMQLAALWFAYHEGMAHMRSRVDEFRVVSGGFHIAEVNARTVVEHPELDYSVEEAREFIVTHTAIRERMSERLRNMGEPPQKRKQGRPPKKAEK